jgi:urocanate hydratase
VTDQTSAHDALNGYIPAGLSLDGVPKLRRTNPQEYMNRALGSMAVHVRAMLEFQQRGAIVFDYGSNIRAQALSRGVANAFDFHGFVPAFTRPLFCTGHGPFRGAALSGDPADIAAIDDVILRKFKHNDSLVRWISMARQRIHYQGLPARICWPGYGERDRLGVLVNRMVQAGALKAPVVFGRDRLDAGSVASPNRETESMRDKSDAIADWPILNALLNTSAGASWVSAHHGGGVGIGYSIHAGMVVVADGTPETEARLQRVLTTDPGTGIMRHADAGYPEAIAAAHRHGIKIPGLRRQPGSGGSPA